MQKTLRLAKIGKQATCHSLRHGFACHLLEDGTDIRFIQQFLGHVKLETTTIYTKVAVPRRPKASPIDSLPIGTTADSGRSEINRLADAATATHATGTHAAAGRSPENPHAARAGLDT